MKTYQNGMNDKTDIKVFILFLLDNIDYPLDFDTIHDIVIESGYVGDFDFAESFSKLLELGHILKDEENGVSYYLISPTGRIVSAELQSKLMLSIREKSLKIAMRFLSFRRRGATPSSRIDKREDGKYTFHCEIDAPTGKLLSLDLTMASRLQAEDMKKKFDKDPEDVYRRLLSVMTWDADYLLD